MHMIPAGNHSPGRSWAGSHAAWVSWGGSPAPKATTTTTAQEVNLTLVNCMPDVPPQQCLRLCHVETFGLNWAHATLALLTLAFLPVSPQPAEQLHWSHWSKSIG